MLPTSYSYQINEKPAEMITVSYSWYAPIGTSNVYVSANLFYIPSGYAAILAGTTTGTSNTPAGYLININLSGQLRIKVTSGAEYTNNTYLVAYAASTANNTFKELTFSSNQYRTDIAGGQYMTFSYENLTYACNYRMVLNFLLYKV